MLLLPLQHLTLPRLTIPCILYLSIETGMRRAAAIKLDLDDIDLENRSLNVQEKGGGLPCNIQE